jgi:hypothetical protein
MGTAFADFGFVVAGGCVGVGIGAAGTGVVAGVGVGVDVVGTVRGFLFGMTGSGGSEMNLPMIRAMPGQF